MFNTNSLRVVIPGGSGQVGQILAEHLYNQGHSVTVLARRPMPAPWRTTQWNAHELDGADVVINLAGRSVDCRYNQTNRREIMESRIQTTRLIGRAIAEAAHPPAIWMNASTATIYRHALDRPMDEASGEIGGGEPGAPSAWRFSIDVATAWERAFFELPMASTRRIALRSAMTMSPSRAGIFDVLLRLVRTGLGGKAASGEQFISWIHYVDFLAAIDFLIAHPDLDGPVNLCSPNPLPNSDFMAALRRAWGTRIGLPTTQWMLEVGAFFLRTESELVLKSRRVVPTRLLNAGFDFKFPDWAEAAQDLVTRQRIRFARLYRG